MSFESFVTTAYFDPGCLTVCERPVSNISWSTWADATDGDALEQLFAALPNPCRLSGEDFLQRFRAIKPSLFTRLQIQTDIACITLNLFSVGPRGKAIEAVLETGESCQISIGEISNEEALSFALPLLSAATPEELECAKDKVELLLDMF